MRLMLFWVKCIFVVVIVRMFVVFYCNLIYGFGFLFFEIDIVISVVVIFCLENEGLVLNRKLKCLVNL